MCKHGFGYQTFQLEEDKNGEVVVHVFDSKLTTEEAHKMNGDELYSWFHTGRNLLSPSFFIVPVVRKMYSTLEYM